MKAYHYIGLSNVYEHIVLQSHTARLHLLENPESHPEVAYVVLLGKQVEPDLEMAALVLLIFVAKPGRDHEVVDYLLAPLLEGILVLGLAVVNLLDDRGVCTKEGVTV